MYNFTINQMLLFFISCFSFILFSNSLPFKIKSWFRKLKLALNFLRFVPPAKKDEDSLSLTPPPLSLLDLPELTLECILERLTPAGLCRMGAVCTDLRDWCQNDHFWEKHMKLKWSRVVGDSARLEWRSKAAARPASISNRGRHRWLSETFSRIVRPSLSYRISNPLPPPDSIMAQYLALESGQLWFPAQIYNRENGHAGFLLSCYDAHISYDSKTDTFQAKYSSHYGNGRRMIEDDISWSRVRAAPVETPPYELHVSDCLGDLIPGDHIEIQWRKSDEFPYGWWYGVVGHEDLCDGNENRCRCHCSDTVMLEFKQYPTESRWRRTTINRKDHREEGNKEKGFYGGIRKLYTDEEISTWRRTADPSFLITNTY